MMMVNNRFSHANQNEQRRYFERRIIGAIALILPRQSHEQLSQILHDQDETADLLELVRSIVSPAIRSYQWLNFRRRLVSTDLDTEFMALGPGRGLSASAAVTYVIHVALKLDQDELADVFSTSEDEIAHRLMKARSHVLGNQRPCRIPVMPTLPFAPQCDLEMTERLDLREHFKTCEECFNFHQHSIELDKDIDSHVEHAGNLAMKHYDSGHTYSQKHGLPAFATLGTLALILIVVMVLFAGADHLQRGNSEPVSLLAADARAESISGWIITATIDGIAAFHPDTREHRTLLRVPMDGMQPPVFMLSPDSTKIAVWRFQDDTRNATSIQIVSIEGELLHRWDWPGYDSPGRLSGWLGNDRLLFIRSPIQEAGESVEQYVSRQARENELRLFDLESESIDVLYTGSVALASAAPGHQHIALLSVHDRKIAERPGRTLEIWEFTDGALGERVAHEADRFPLDTTHPVWATDGSSIYYPRLTAQTIDARNGPEYLPEIARTSISGSTDVLTNQSESPRMRLLGVSQSQERVLFLKENLSETQSTWDLTEVNPGNDQVITLESHIAYPFFFNAVATWLGDGETAIINDARVHYIYGEETSLGINAGATRYVMIDSGNDLTTFKTEFGLWGVDAWGQPTLRWVPDDHIRSSRGDLNQPIQGDFSASEIVDNPGGTRITASYSRVSPDGKFALFEHVDSGAPVIWEIETDTGRILAGKPTPEDLTWTSSTPSLVGVQSDDIDRLITFFAARTTRIADFYDYRSADPSGILLGRGNGADWESLVNDDLTRTYASPAVSPSGNTIAWFVRDEEYNATEIWVAGHELEPRRVARWRDPDDALVKQPPLLRWTSDHTFLAAMPDSWADGFPRTASLWQFTIRESRTTTVDSAFVHEFEVRGDERGIVLKDLEVQNGNDLVAFHVRTYSSRNPEQGLRDTISIAPADDVTQSIVVGRGSPGSGFSWSPTGDWLAFELNGRLSATRLDGSNTVILADADEQARHPMWLPNGELFFTTGPEFNPQLNRILAR